MSETTFKNHLEDLEKVLKQILGDIESGPDNKVNGWYEDMLDIVYYYEDEIDSNLYMRIGLDEDSIEDGEILEATEDIEVQEIEDIEDDIDLENTEDVDEEEIDIENDENEIEIEETGGTKKTITININFPTS